MAGYQVADAYQNQEGEGRVVKHLLFTALVEMEDPARPDTKIRVEKMFRRGETIPAEMLDDATLERGERLDSFFTDEELDDGQDKAAPGPTPSAIAIESGETPAFDEMSEAELADYIMQKKPNTADTIKMAGNDPDTANRLLEAEHIATDGEPRAGVVKGLNAIAESE